MTDSRPTHAAPGDPTGATSDPGGTAAPTRAADGDRLGQLAQAGVSIWLDDLSRERLDSGNLQELITTRHVVGVTTNPTIFAGALAKGSAYDGQLRKLAGRGTPVEHAIREITVADVQQACDVFSGVWQATGGIDGRVSLEVDPTLAHDTDATLAQARELWQAVDRPNLLIKIPATREGLPAITGALADGISVNVTLIFSVARYEAVIDAYLDGLEQAAHRGQEVAGLVSVASFFVSRVDTEIDQRLEKIGTDAALALRGKAGVANSRLAYAAYQQKFTGGRWDNLLTLGAKAQRPLWASTGVKNPDYPDTLYVTELVVADTVNTMPEKTLQAYADHGELPAGGDAVTGTTDAARRVFDDLTAAGIDLDDVFRVLEDEGVEKFEKSWQELGDTVREQLDATR